MLRLLSLLQTHRYWPGPELSDRLEVSPRTLRRDIDRLRELGYAVDAVRGVAGGYQLRAGGSLPPLLLEDEEAVAIAVGLRTAAAGAVGRRRGPSVQALTKVIALMPPRLRRQMDAVSLADRDARPVGGRPDRRRRRCSPRWPRPAATTSWSRFGYTAREAEPTDRRVEPHRLVVARPPLVPRRLRPRPPGLALLPRRPDRRAAHHRPAVPAARAARRRRAHLRPGGHPPDAAAVRRPRCGWRSPPRWSQREVGRWGSVTPDGDGCVLEMNVDSLDWPVMVLGLVGADFVVESPPELAERIAEVGARFIRVAAG